jgi:hypothetical protein
VRWWWGHAWRRSSPLTLLSTRSQGSILAPSVKPFFDFELWKKKKCTHLILVAPTLFITTTASTFEPDLVATDNYVGIPSACRVLCPYTSPPPWRTPCTPSGIWVLGFLFIPENCPHLTRTTGP